MLLSLLIINFNSLLLFNHIILTKIFIVSLVFFISYTSLTLKITTRFLWIYISIIMYITIVYWQISFSFFIFNLKFFNLINLNYVSTFF